MLSVLGLESGHAACPIRKLRNPGGDEVIYEEGNRSISDSLVAERDIVKLDSIAIQVGETYTWLSGRLTSIP
jgi:hypothetical protein